MLNLFNVLLTEFFGLYCLYDLYRGSGIGGNAWKIVRSAENEKEWATAHFQVLVATENFVSPSRQ